MIRARTHPTTAMVNILTSIRELEQTIETLPPTVTRSRFLARYQELACEVEILRENPKRYEVQFLVTAYQYRTGQVRLVPKRFDVIHGHGGRTGMNTPRMIHGYMAALMLAACGLALPAQAEPELLSYEGRVTGTYEMPEDEQDFEIRGWFSSRQRCDARVATYSMTMRPVGSEDREERIYVRGEMTEWADDSLLLITTEVTPYAQPSEYEHIAFRRMADGQVAVSEFAEDSRQWMLPAGTLFPMQELRLLLAVAKRGEVEVEFLSLGEDNTGRRARSTIRDYTGELLSDRWPKAWWVMTEYWPLEGEKGEPMEVDWLLVTPDGVELFHRMDTADDSFLMSITMDHMLPPECAVE